MYAVITDLLETVVGRKSEALLTDSIWQPLGMLSTAFTIPTSTGESSRLARGYYWDPSTSGSPQSTQKGRYVPEPYTDLLAISGAGATISTVNDYALWVKALLDAADIEKAKNTSTPIINAIWRHLVAGEEVVQHSGALTGFGAEVFLLPDKGYGIITMANTYFTSNVAGQIIAGYLLRRKLSLTPAHDLPFPSVCQHMHGLPGMALHNSPGRSFLRGSSHSQTPMSQFEELPLYSSIARFAGEYTHPAYGSINLTIGSWGMTSTLSKTVLDGLFYPSTWQPGIQLSHITNTVFAVKSFLPHGLGNVVSGEDIGWEELDGELQAVFEFGLDGEKIERMGIEIEEAMIEMARKKGEKYWREGMIWFEKI